MRYHILKYVGFFILLKIKLRRHLKLKCKYLLLLKCCLYIYPCFRCTQEDVNFLKQFSVLIDLDECFCVSLVSTEDISIYSIECRK